MTPMKAFQAVSQTLFCTALAALCLGGAVSGARGADDPTDVRREIEATHVKQAHADTSGDRKLWKQMFQDMTAPDFTFTMPNGTQESRAEFQESQILRGLALLKGSQEDYHVERVTQTGDKATEEGYLTYRVSIVDTDGRIGPKGKTHVVTGRNTYRAGWVKVGASWKATDVHLLKHEEQTDGKDSGNPRQPSAN